MNVNNCRIPSFLIAILVIALSSLISHSVIAQSSSLDLSSLFGSSSSTSDKDQFTNITPNQTSGKSKFTNSEYGFEFEFPSNWEVLSPYSSGLNMEGIPVQVASVRSTVDDGIHDLVTISVLKPSRYLDTDAMQVRTSNLSPQEHAKIVTDLLPEYGFKVIRENPVTVGGLPAYRIEYMTYNYDTEVFVVKQDGTMYKLEFGTPPLRAPESLPIFNQMVDSFKFVNSSSITNNTQPVESKQNSSQSAINNSRQNSPLASLTSNNIDSTSLGPVAEVQEFNQDTGNGPICCDVRASSPGQVSAPTASTDIPTTDDATGVSTNNDDENDDNNDRNNDNDENDDD
jgi:hypothetical protein